ARPGSAPPTDLQSPEILFRVPEGNPMLNRRILMLSAAGAGLVAALPVSVLAQSAAAQADGVLDALLTGWFEDNVDRNPTMATSLGIDRGGRAHLAGKLGDRSLEAAAQDRTRARERWAQIRDWAPEGLSDGFKVTLAVAQFQAETAAIQA